ncbi:MAG: sigma 54-interacting transcriptional regulator [Polyangiaceae bacterium]
MPQATTETDPAEELRGRRDEAILGVVLAHHVVRAFVGAREPLPRGRKVWVGRAEGSVFPGAFDGGRCSRRHAELESDGDAILVRDLESRNGTFVNGARVSSARAVEGDVIGVGDVLLVVARAPLFLESPVTSASMEGDLLGVSAALAALKVQIAAAARSPVVGIVGETGSGKELVARALHAASGRTGAFVAVNCAAIADGVLASELFGHVGGAFSGATASRDGLVAAAKKGTLFLDELASASPSFQASLLRLMETGDYRPVGGNATKHADVGFIAALQPEVATRALERGDFRRDLWTRVARWLVTIPALRERREDIPLLAMHFAERRALSAGSSVGPALASDFVLALLRHDWPGNVRELRGFVERAVDLAGPSDTLHFSDALARDLALAAGVAPRPAAAAPAAAAPAASDAAHDAAEDAADRRRSPTPRPTRAELEALLAEHAGNVTALAKARGVPRKTVYRWLEAFGLATRGER